MGRRPLRLLALAGALGLVEVVTAATAGSSPPSSWTQYHGDRAGSGVAIGYSRVDTARPRWRSPALDGELFGQPVTLGDRVYVATENDVVYALSASTGRVVWRRYLGSPVPAGRLPCGNISPSVGVTGTPVIDPAREELFVVADVWAHGAPEHVLVGLSAVSGRTVLSQRVDTAGSDPAATLQRTGLALDAGRVVFGFGGNYGDCGQYRGRVESVPETGGAPWVYTVDAGSHQREGAIWMGGAAPVVDPRGDVWVAVGNGSSVAPGDPYDHSDAVLELTPRLRLRQYFAPADWAAENAADADLSSAPALVGPYVVASGKDRNVYLLSRAHLGGIGHPLDELASICSSDVDGGVAVVGTTVYLACEDGPVAISVAGGHLRVLWRASSGGGPPIVIGDEVWTVGQDGSLDGLARANGSLRQRVTVGAAANHFPTPGVGDGLMLVPVARRVIAYGAS